MRAISAGMTDVGRERDLNEDRYVIVPDRQVYVVADGMGGHNCGEVASGMATKMVSSFFADHARAEGDAAETTSEGTPGSLLATSLRRANASIHERAMNSLRHRGMGTTVVAAAFSPRERRMYVAHAGDSRCYRLRDGRLTQLTRDHSLLEEALRARPEMSAEDLGHLPGNVITRALGVESTVDVEVISDGARVGDIYLLCSDGLHGFVDEETIGAIVASHEADLSGGCAALVAEANANGGGDNITVVLVQMAASVGEDDDDGKSIWDHPTAAAPASVSVVAGVDSAASPDIGTDDTARVTALTDPEEILAALERADDAHHPSSGPPPSSHPPPPSAPPPPVGAAASDREPVPRSSSSRPPDDEEA
ncbi:MAG: protein phosphatase 2C domain-containing protein [Myxococcota bacterium]